MPNWPEPKLLGTKPLNLAAYEYGIRDNPPLLLLHGALSTGLAWHDVASELAKHWFVIAIDQRGRALSDHAPRRRLLNRLIRRRYQVCARALLHRKTTHHRPLRRSFKHSRIRGHSPAIRHFNNPHRTRPRTRLRGNGQICPTQRNTSASRNQLRQLARSPQMASVPATRNQRRLHKTTSSLAIRRTRRPHRMARRSKHRGVQEKQSNIR